MCRSPPLFLIVSVTLCVCLHPLVPTHPSSWTLQVLSPWDTFCLCAVGIVTVPIRLVLVLIAFLGCGLLCTCAGSRMFGSWVLAPVPWLLRLFVWAVGVTDVRWTGLPAPRHVAPVVVSNHFGLLETVLLVVACKATVVTAQENTRVPILGAIIRGLGCIVVDRTGHTAGRPGMPTAVDALVAHINRDDVGAPRVLVFPEGTTTNQTAVLSFKRGAFVAGKAVQPVACRLRVGRTDPAWVGDGPAYPLILLRLMATWSSTMEVTFLPVLSPPSGSEPDAFAALAQQSIARALGVPCCNYSFQDSWLGQRAYKLGLPCNSALLEWNTFKGTFPDWTLDKAHAALLMFAAADTDRNGVLRRGEFPIACRASNVHDQDVVCAWGRGGKGRRE